MGSVRSFRWLVVSININININDMSCVVLRWEEDCAQFANDNWGGAFAYLHIHRDEIIVGRSVHDTTLAHSMHSQEASAVRSEITTQQRISPRYVEAWQI